ncbi:MAG: O-antigen ligase family protein [Planctomycetes bacterium]|nr:O-antigen ligase family protein [Planctomycetota bacterium]
MARIFHLLVLGLLSCAIVLKLLVCGSTAGTGVNIFITSFIIIAFLIRLVYQAFSGELRLINLLGLGGLLLVWAITIILSPLWAGYKFAAFGTAFIWLGDIMLFYLVIQLVMGVVSYQLSVVRLISGVFLATGAVIVCFALYQYLWGLEEMRQTIIANSSGGTSVPQELEEEFMSRVNANEPFGTFIYQNSLGGFLVLVIPIFLACSIYSFLKRNWKLVIGYWLLLVLMSFILYSTGAKGAWVAALISIILLFTIALWNRFNKPLRFIVPPVVIIGLAVLFWALWGNESMQTRFGYWQGAWGVIKNNLWTGVGLSNFADPYTMYKPVWAGETTTAHNVLLEVFSELGIIGIITFCTIWLIILIRGFKGINNLKTEENTPLPASPRGGEGKGVVVGVIIGAFVAFLLAQAFQGVFAISDIPEIGLAVFFIIWLVSFLLIYRIPITNYYITGLIAGICGFLLHSLVDFNFSEAGLSMSIWLAGGLLVGLVFKSKEHIIKTGFVLKATVLAVALAIVFLVNLWLVPRLILVDYMIDMSQEELISGRVEAGKKLAMALESNTWDIRPNLVMAPFLHMVNKPEKVRFDVWQKVIYGYINKAIELSPFSASLYFMKGTFLQEDAEMLAEWIKTESDIAQKVSFMRRRDERLKESAECFSNAVSLYPTKPEYMYRLGKALEAIDEIPAALEAYKQALRLNEGVKLKRLKLTPEMIKDIMRKSSLR